MEQTASNVTEDVLMPVLLRLNEKSEDGTLLHGPYSRLFSYFFLIRKAKVNEHFHLGEKETSKNSAVTALIKYI